MRDSGYQKHAAYSLLCAPVKHWHTKEKTVQGAGMLGHRDHTGFGPNEEMFPSVQRHVTPACSISLEPEDHG